MIEKISKLILKADILSLSNYWPHFWEWNPMNEQYVL